MKCSGIAKRWDTKTQQKNISAQIGRDPFLFHPLHKGRDSYLVKDASCFWSWSEIRFFSSGSTSRHFRLQRIASRNRFLGEFCEFRSSSTQAKSQKNHMQISYVVLLYKGHHSIFGEKSWQIKTNQTNSPRKFTSSLRAPKTDGAPTVLEFSFPRFSEILCTS